MLRGYSGYNTRWALKVAERAMEGVCPEAAAPPAAVTVFFGANDASLPDRRSGFQHVPLLEYQSNLRALCGFLKVSSLTNPQMVLFHICSVPNTCSFSFSPWIKRKGVLFNQKILNKKNKVRKLLFCRCLASRSL